LLGPISLLLIVSLPITFFVPLLTTTFWFFMQTDITLARAVSDLFRIDKFLFAIVVVFGVVFPFLKAIMSVVCWYYFEISTIERPLQVLGYLAKLSMLDIMLLAFFVVAFKGVGMGTVHVRYGLYILCLASYGVTFSQSRNDASSEKNATPAKGSGLEPLEAMKDLNRVKGAWVEQSS
jgi:paraquat-inducible protein A